MNLLKVSLTSIIILFFNFSSFAQPSNDDCSNPTVIIPFQSCSSTVGDLTGSNKSSLSPSNTFYDVWYTFTAKTTIHYLSVFSSGDFRASFQVYSGNCGSLTSIANFAGTTAGTAAILSGLVVGQTYYYRVYHNGSTLPTTKEFETCVENYILNNDCLGAVEITPSAAGEPCGGVRGRTSGATQSMPGCTGNAEDDVWYKFQAKSTTHFVEADGDASFNAVLQIFKGDCNTLSSVQCINNNSTAGGVESIKLTNLTIGDWYYARVYDFGATNSLTPYFNICVTTPPKNDNCENAIEVNFGKECTSEFSDGTYATQSLVAGTNMGDASDDVWFKFTPDTSVAFISIQPSMDYDPIVQLFSACGTPTTGLATFYNDNNYAQGVFGTAIVKGLVKGNTYYYRVYEKSNVLKDMMSFTTCVVRPAINDDCENATKIIPGLKCQEISADGSYATQSTPSTGGKGDANDDLWYKFTATSTSHNITVNASLKYNPIVQLFSGCMTPTTGLSTFYEDALFPIGGSYTAKINGLTAGNTYFYRVYDKESTNPQTMTFTTCVTTAPPNDDCINAKQLYVNNTCDEVVGDGKYATQSVENACGGSTVGSNDDDIWYKFTATSNNAFISVTPDDSQYDPIVQVFSACGTPINPAFCEDNLYSKGKFGTALVSNLINGNTYYYRIYDKALTKQDTMTIKTCVVSAVENDNCVNALNVTPGLTCNEIISDATYSTESFAKGSCGTSANDDVWFKFTANNDSLFISVSPKDNSYDPVIEVYNNCPSNATLNLLCEDNAYQIGKFGTKIIIGLTPGNIYYYRVYDKDGINEDTMEFTTCIVNPVSNNDCLSAKTLTSSTNFVETIGDGTYASQSFNQCSGSAGASNDDVWYKFIATSTKENISVKSSKLYDPVIEVYTSCSTPISPAICNDLNFPVNGFGTISINTIPNNTYYYRVYDKNTTNNYPLTFSTSVTHAPLNDDCLGAFNVTSGTTCSEVEAEGTYATKSAGTSANCAGDDSDDVWFKFKATNSNQTIYVNASENYNPIVQLYSNCTTTPTPFPTATSSCNDIRYPVAGVGSNTFTGLTVGNEYYYRVYDSGNTIKSPLKFSTCVTNPASPPTNDNPCKATLILPKLTCEFQTFTNEAATASSGVSIPKCGTLAPNDVWFKTVVPFSGSLIIDSKELTVNDGTISVYKGTCTSLIELNCDINSGAGEMPKMTLTSLSPGDTIWIRFWSDKITATGSFGICVTKPKEAPLVDGCSNLSFQNGTESWFGTTGEVYKIAGKTDVPNPFYKSTISNIGTGPFFNVMTSGVDPVCGFPLVPRGYSSSLRLGDGVSVAKKGATIEQYFKVQKSNPNFIYNYAVVFNAERTGTNKHQPYQQPFFKVEVFDDAGNPISCGDYLVGAFSEPGFLISPTNNLVTYKPWTKVSIDLTDYIDKEVHVRYTTGDCTEGGHYGYAYITCNCAPFEITKLAKVCIGDTAKLYGPKGAQSYTWKDPSGNVISTKDSVYIKTTSIGKFKYTLDVTMFGTSMCQNTLEAEIEVGATPTLVITDPDPVCNPNTVDLTSLNVTQGSSPNLIYTYYSDTITPILLPNKEAINVSGKYFIKGAKSTTCVSTKPVNVIINPLPKVGDKSATICSGEKFKITPANTLPDVVLTGTKYKWTVVSNADITGESNETTGQDEISQILTNITSSAQDVIYTVTPFTPDCDGTPFKVTVTVNPAPKIDPKSTTICTNTPFEITPTNTSPDILPTGTTYTWTYTDNNKVTNESNSTTDELSIKSYTNLLNVSNIVQSVDYTVTPKSGTCTGPNFKVTINVNPSPLIPDFTKNICTGSSFDATPTDNGTTTLVPVGTNFSWPTPIITGGITGGSAQTNLTSISQTLTNPSTINQTATYSITAKSNTTPNCISTFEAKIIVEPKIKPEISCGTFSATTMEFTWLNIPSVTSYEFVYKVGSTGTLSTPATLNSSIISKEISGLSSGSNVYFTLTPVGVLCPLPETKMCSNCTQPSIENNDPLSPTDFEICVGETITLKSSEIPLNATQWSMSNAGLVSSTVLNTKNLNEIKGLAEGKTDIYFENNLGCAKSIIITVNPLPTFTPTATSQCENDPLYLQANYLGATKVVWTGPAPFNYSNTATTDSKLEVVDKATISNYNGTYTVEVTDNKGCVKSENVSVTINQLPTVSAGTDKSICIGSSVTLTGTGASTYTWDNNISDNVVFSPTDTKTYTVTGTDAKGCKNTGTIKVTVNTLPTVSAGSDQYVCEGSPLTLSGSGASSYTWDGGVTDNVPFTPTTAKDYTVTGTDVNGCKNTDVVHVYINALPNFTPTATSQCENDPLYLQANYATAKKVVWSSTNGYANTATSDTKLEAFASTTSLHNGLYSVEVTDQNNCVKTKTVNVTINPLPNVNAGTDKIICIGDKIKLSASGALTYKWNNEVIDNTEFSPLVTNTYTVTGTDSKGCKNTDDILITINQLPVISAGADKMVCFGEQVTLSGTGASTYTWDGGVIDNTPFTASKTTDYTVTGIDNNGCKNSDLVRVNVNPLPIFNPTAASQCENDPLFLQANYTSATKVVWTGPNSYTNTATSDTKLQVIAKANSTVNGLYSVEVTDAIGCKKTETVNVFINPLPTVSAGLDLSICIGNITKLNGSGAFSYIWDNGVIDNTNFSPTITKTYTVIGTDTKGCKNSDQMVVTVNPIPDFKLTVNAPCEQETLTFSVDLSSNPSTAGITTSIWSGPNNFNSTSLNPTIDKVTPLASGTYSLTLEDNNTCVKTKTILAKVSLIDKFQLADINPKCINDEPFLLPTPNIPGGTWSSSDNSSIQNTNSAIFEPKKSKPDIDNKVDVTYSTFNAVPPRKCPASITKTILVNPIPDSNFYAINPIICIEDTLHLVINKFDPNVAYTWNLGNGSIIKQNTEKLNFIYLKEGDFSIRLVAELGSCKVKKTIEDYIHVIPKPTYVDFTQSETEIDFYNPEILFKSFTNGKYLQWDFGDGNYSNYKNPSHKFPEKPGEYIISLTASNMENNYCSKTITKSIFMPEPVIYFIPNTFTPNGDEINNVFQPIFTYGYDPQNYSFYIYNRWGEVIFESHDSKIGWDGTYGDNLVQNDTYIWKLEFKEKLKEDRHFKTGHVNVFR